MRSTSTYNSFQKIKQNQHNLTITPGQMPPLETTKTLQKPKQPQMKSPPARSITHQQPLLARSSNSGTSFKRSDFSQSECNGGADVSSEQTQSNIWAKPMLQQPAAGRLTSAFTNSKRDAVENCQSTLSLASKRALKEKKLAETNESLSSAQRQNDQNKSRKRDGSLKVVEEMQATSQPAKSQQNEGHHQQTEQNQFEPQAKSKESVSMRLTRSKTRPSTVVETKQVRITPNLPNCNSSQTDSNAKFNGQQSSGKPEIRKAGATLESVEVVDHVMEQQPLDVNINDHQKSSDVSQVSNNHLAVPATDSLKTNSCQISSAHSESVQDNPLCCLIKQFQNDRSNAQYSGENKPTIDQFLKKFEKEMINVEAAYQMQQQARQEQMRLFEQTFGNRPVIDGSKSILDISTSFNDQRKVTQAQTQRSEFPTQLRESSTVIDMDGANREDPSHCSQQSSQQKENQKLSCNAAPYSELSTGEVYESYQFHQNSLMGFYPKDVRRCLQRRKQLSSSYVSTEKLVQNLKAPKVPGKAKKLRKKMHSLALCQINMMQVLLQKISRKSKTIKKQEKIVNDNLKRKRIYLDRENFDIMTVLRQSMRDNIDVPTSRSDAKRKSRGDHSPCLSGNTSSKGARAPPPLYSTSMQQIGEEESSIGCDTKRKQSSSIYDPNNTLSTQAQDNNHAQKTSGKRDNMDGAQDDSRASNQIKTPDPPSCKINSHEQLKERQVQQAFNLSEIDDNFLGGYKNSNQKQDGALSVGAGSKECGGHKLGIIGNAIGDACDDYGNEVHLLDSNENENLKIISSPQRPTQLFNQEQNAFFDFDNQQINKFMMSEQVHPHFEDPANPRAGGRKLQSTQAMRNKKKAVTVSNEVIILQNQTKFSERLAEGEGNFAIADLGANNKRSEMQLADSIVKICLKDPVHAQASEKSEKAPKSTISRKSRKQATAKSKGNYDEKALNLENSDLNQISNQISEVANDTARELSPLHSQHQAYEDEIPQIQQQNHQLSLYHSQSLPARMHSSSHMIDDQQFFHPNVQDLSNMQHQQALVQTHESMQIDLTHQQVNNFTIPQSNQVQGEFVENKQPSPITANSQHRAHQGSQSHLFELQLHRSQSLIVPSNSYMQHRTQIVDDYNDHMPLQHHGSHSGDGQPHQVSSQGNQDVANRGMTDNSGVVDNLFDDGHVDFSMDQSGGLFQYQLNSSSNHFNNKDVANPYEAAKRRLYMSLQKGHMPSLSTQLHQLHQDQIKESEQTKPSDQSQMQINGEQSHLLPGQSNHQMLEVSPMPNQMTQTPQSKVMQQDGINSMMASQFMGGVVVDSHQNNLNAHHLQQSDQQMLQQEQHLMSGGRMSLGNNTSYNPFLYSAGVDSIIGGKTGQNNHLGVVGEVSNARNYLNTPGAMLNGGQQATEKHRESVNVDAWNVLDQSHAMNNMDVLSHFNQTSMHPQVVVSSVDMDTAPNEANRPFVDDEIYQQFQPNSYM